MFLRCLICELNKLR